MMSRTDWLRKQPFSLMLSAGFFGFFAHAGLLRALEERRLAPAQVIGVSAGALAGGLWASGVPAQDIADTLHGLRREDFWDPGVPLGGLLRGRKFEHKLREALAPTGVENLHECRTPFSPVVHDVFARRPLVLRHGPVHVAIRASCTVPLLFRPIVHQGRLLVDGGVSDRCGFTGLGAGGRVLLHYLPSRRRFGSPSATPTRVPGADALILQTPDLPRVTPFQLASGPVAYRRTLDHARRWLDTAA